MIWQTTRYRIELSRAQVMGIVNVTPDSFSDGGLYRDSQAAIRHCEQLLTEGADLLDIGGESTRPGARTPDDGEEQARVLPVLRAALGMGVPVSVDTSNPALMRAALDLGADIVNDVRSLRRPGALSLLAGHASVGVCLMHMRGEPGQMQQDPVYGDVAAEVCDFLRVRCRELAAAGVASERIVVDPGIGFGKTAAHNLELMRRQADMDVDGRPWLLGWSRKSTLGGLTGRQPLDRVSASVAAALLAVQRGASIVRVHDVAATVDALKVWQAVQTQGAGPMKGRDS